jgi:hypothetical protein
MSEQIKKAIANPFQLGRVIDLSPEINVVTNQWGLLNQLGIFRTELKTQKQVLVPRTFDEDTILTDRNWDERNNTIKRVQRDVLPMVIPHFPVDDAITPNDVDGQVDWDSLLQGGNGILAVDKVRAEKMMTIRKAHALTLEFARAQMLRDGTVYAPNGTVVTNFYTEFGLTRQTIFMDLASATDNPIGKFEDVFASIQDGVSTGQVITDVLVLCSPSFFNALITNAFVFESYQYFQQPQGPRLLNGRLTATGTLDARYRTFEYAGMTFVEVRGSVNGTPYVADGQAYAFPRGTDSFRTYFAPANRFNSVNKTAQESYYFEYLNEKDDIIELMTETNFMNALLRPQIVVTLDMDAS